MTKPHTIIKSRKIIITNKPINHLKLRLQTFRVWSLKFILIVVKNVT